MNTIRKTFAIGLALAGIILAAALEWLSTLGVLIAEPEP